MVHLNSQKRFIFDNQTCFITICTSNRYPYFKNDKFCELMIKQLKVLKEYKKCMIFGFIIIYDHMHLVIRSDGMSHYSDDIQFLKSNFSKNANRMMGLYEMPIDSLANIKKSTGNTEGADDHPRLQYDKKKISTNLFDEIELHIKKNKMQRQFKNIPKFKWQKSFHDHYIRNNKDFRKHLKYINLNHIKHKLPTNWKYVGYNYHEELINLIA